MGSRAQPGELRAVGSSTAERWGPAAGKYQAQRVSEMCSGPEEAGGHHPTLESSTTSTLNHWHLLWATRPSPKAKSCGDAQRGWGEAPSREAGEGEQQPCHVCLQPAQSPAACSGGRAWAAGGGQETPQGPRTNRAHTAHRHGLSWLREPRGVPSASRCGAQPGHPTAVCSRSLARGRGSPKAPDAPRPGLWGTRPGLGGQQGNSPHAGY